jgi:hypothetical protein
MRVKSVTATPTNSVSGLLEKLIITELLKKLPQLESRGSQEVLTGPYPSLKEVFTVCATVSDVLR